MSMTTTKARNGFSSTMKIYPTDSIIGYFPDPLGGKHLPSNMLPGQDQGAEPISVDANMDSDDSLVINRWNIQVACIVLVAVVGVLILLIFLVGLWLSRRTFRKEVKHPPSRMRALWENVQVIPYKAGMFFRRSSTAPVKLFTPEEVNNLALNACHIHVDSEHMEDDPKDGHYSAHEQKVTDDVVQQDPESSDMIYEDARVDISADPSSSSSMTEEVFSCQHIPTRAQHRQRGSSPTARCEEILFYKVITI